MIDEKEYSSIHYWIKKSYGKASKCENKECKGKSKNYQWALKKGYSYERKRINFLQLCVSCHTIYDFDKEKIRPRVYSYIEKICLCGLKFLTFRKDLTKCQKCVKEYRMETRRKRELNRYYRNKLLKL